MELQTHRWVNLKLFRKQIGSLIYETKLNFKNYKAIMHSAISKFRNIQSVPFGQHKRFSDNSIYVDMDHPYVTTRLNSLYDTQKDDVILDLFTENIFNE